MKRFLWPALLIPALVLNCLTDSGTNDEKKGGSSRKVSFNYSGELKLFEFQRVNFTITVTPAPAPGEQILTMLYHGTEQIEEEIQPGKQSTSFPFGGIREGDFKFHAAVVDSLEYLALKELAPWRGSASLDVKVRKITIDISAVPDIPVTCIEFNAVSPEQAWIPADTEYQWDFGDGNTQTVAGSAMTYHQYARGGTYQAKLELLALERPDDSQLTTIATDTLTVTVAGDSRSELVLAVGPDDTTSVPYSNITFRVGSNLSRTDYPDQVRWVTDFGDGATNEYTGYVDNWTFLHWYKEPGDYLIQVTAYDLAAGTMLGRDTALVHISNLPLLQKMKSVYMLVKGYTVRHQGTMDQSGTYTDISTWPDRWQFGNAAGVITWTGRDFTASGQIGSQDWTISGRVSLNGTVVDSLVYEEKYENLNYNGGTWIWYKIVVLKNVPFGSVSPTLAQFNQQSTGIGQYVTDFEYTEEITTAGSSTSTYLYYTPFEWQNTSKGMPELTVEFR